MPEVAAEPAPIVLVHGAWHGGWCWDHVAEALRARGHAVTALDLPGHHEPGSLTRKWNRIGGYIRALDAAVAGSPEPPVVVAHSMGGYVLQRYLERHQVRAAVLLASVPASGALGANLRLLRSHPWILTRSALTFDYAPPVRSEALVRELFFRPDTPADIVRAVHPRLQNESALAILTMLVRAPKPDRVSSPVHVVAASDDAIFTLAEQHHLAAAFGVDLEIIPLSGHDVMLDTARDDLVDAIARIAE